jgi:dienelactone hydrolase
VRRDVRHAQSDAAPIPTRDFFRAPQYVDVSVSPTGEHLAASTLIDERTGALAVIRLADLKLTGSARLRGDTCIGKVVWVAPTRLVAQIMTRLEVFGTQVPNGELMAMDVDGGRQAILSGPRTTVTGGAENTSVFAELIGPVRGDERCVLVATWPVLGELGELGELTRSVERLDVVSGKRKRLFPAPAPGPMQFLADSHGHVRFAYMFDVRAGLRSRLYHRPEGGASWQLLHDEGQAGLVVAPVGFDQSETYAYLVAERPDGPNAIETLDLATLERRELVRDAAFDPVEFLFGAQHAHAIGAYYATGKWRVEVFDRASADAKLLLGLHKAFPGELVSLTSYSADGRYAVFEVASDRRPGDYCLYERATKRATALVGRRPWIDPARMGERFPVTAKARDGITLYGYVTLPPGSQYQGFPLLVWVDTIPATNADLWRFDPASQFFANRGFAVLQVNARGAVGRGRAFARRALGDWGGLMQQDLADAMRETIATGLADPERICIGGVGLYGGYAAVMGAIAEPALYRCAIGFGGLYDLDAVAKARKIASSEYTADALRQLVGTDFARLRERSPVHRADALRAPVLLIAGAQDPIAVPSHARRLRKAVEQRGGAIELMMVDDERGSFAREANLVRAYDTIAAFLRRHLGGAVATAAP